MLSVMTSTYLFPARLIIFSVQMNASGIVPVQVSEVRRVRNYCPFHSLVHAFLISINPINVNTQKSKIVHSSPTFRTQNFKQPIHHPSSIPPAPPPHPPSPPPSPRSLYSPYTPSSTSDPPPRPATRHQYPHSSSAADFDSSCRFCCCIRTRAFGAGPSGGLGRRGRGALVRGRWRRLYRG